MLKKGLAVAVILLFIGLAFAPSINAVDDPVPDLDCTGDLEWSDIEPGETVTGSFTVENIGDPGSELDWEIESYPDWGIWTLDPDGWTGLLPVAPVLVDVEVVLPDEIEDDLMGEVLIVNLENSSDYCIIDAWIRVKSIDDATSLEFELQRIKELVKSIDLRKIIVNPYGVIDTLEEISTIIEEDEDCGCEDDSSGLEWYFPIICISLFPSFYISIILLMLFSVNKPFLFLQDLGKELGCFWITWYPFVYIS